MTVTVPRTIPERGPTTIGRTSFGAVVLFFGVVALFPWPAALVGAAGVGVLLGVGGRRTRGGERRPAPASTAFAVACGALLASSLVSAAVHPGGLSGVRAIAQFGVLATIALLFRRAPRSDAVLGTVWSGVTVGAVLAGLSAPVAVGVFGVTRAAGIGGHAIAFGDLALLMGVSSVALSPFADRAPVRLPPRVVRVAPTAAVVGGVLASALSGARGGWLAAPAMILLLVTRRRSVEVWLPKGIVVVGVAAAAAGVALGGGMPVERLAEAPGDVRDYVAADVRVDDRDRRPDGTTIGARFEAWRSAGDAFASSPLVGIGWGNLQDHFRDDVDRGDRHPRIAEFEHAHQQLLGALASGGVLGGAATVALAVVPAMWFHRARRSGCARDRSVGTAGLLAVTSYVVFGLTEGILDNLAPVSFYGVFVGALVSQLVPGDRPPAGPSSSRPTTTGQGAWWTTY